MKYTFYDMRCDMKNESKEQRFKRIPEKRVQTVLDSIRKLSQCANRRMYEWNDTQLETIWRAVESELSRCRERFDTAQKEQFRL